jgi:ketosteroid isomerase-like protein
MAESDTRATVNKLYRAYERRDVEGVAALLHDDIDWIIYAPVTLFPFAGPRRGRTAVLEALAGIAASFALDSHTIEIMVVEGERAAVMADLRFTQRTTGRILRFRVANFLRVQDGRLVEFREFANTFDVVEQTLGRELEI